MSNTLEEERELIAICERSIADLEYFLGLLLNDQGPPDDLNLSDKAERFASHLMRIAQSAINSHVLARNFALVVRQTEEYS